MPRADDDDEGARDPDDVDAGPRPDPLDRPWVHPSELRSFVATPPPDTHEVKPREWAIGLGSAVAAVIATVLVLVAFGALGGNGRAPAPRTVVAPPDGVVDFSVADRVAANVAPSVVTVRVIGPDGPTPVGSGVAIQSDRVMTNAHLLNGATAVDVVTEDGTTVPAKVVGTDPQTDLTLLSITGGQLSTVAALASDPTRIGTTVIAVAATRAGRYRVDIDVVSDENRLLDAGTGTTVAGLVETGIQAGPAWSGGALLDVDGNLVGLLTSPASAPPGGGLLAMPAGMLRDVEDQLDSSGAVHHGWMGVVFAKDAVERPAGGARLGLVVPGGPAAKAGLGPGDIVTQAGDTPISGMADLLAAVRALRPQDPLDVGYVTVDGKDHHTRVTLDTADPQQYPATG